MSLYRYGSCNDDTGRAWLDSYGCLLFGKYSGDDVNNAAKKDPDYLRWMLENVEDMNYDDRETIQGVLDFAARGKRYQ